LGKRNWRRDAPRLKEKANEGQELTPLAEAAPPRLPRRAS